MDKALETQLANIQKRTGKTIDELTALVKASGLVKHGQAVAMLKDKLGMGHGDANVVVWEKTQEAFKTALYGSTMMSVSGYIQREGEVVHLIARSLADMSPLLATVGRRDIALKAPRQPGDEFRNGGPNWDHRAPGFVKDGSLKHNSRDFR